MVDRDTDKLGPPEENGERRSIGVDREFLRQYMAHAALIGVSNGNTYIPNESDVDADFFPALNYGEESAALPDGETVEVAPEMPSTQDRDVGQEPKPRRYHRDVDPGIPAVSVIQQKIERRASLFPEQKPWGDARDIAAATGLELDIVNAFIERNRSLLGNQFRDSEIRRRSVGGKPTSLMTEHFSGQFMEWAIASLKAAIARRGTSD